MRTRWMVGSLMRFRGSSNWTAMVLSAARYRAAVPFPLAPLLGRRLASRTLDPTTCSQRQIVSILATDSCCSHSCPAHGDTADRWCCVAPVHTSMQDWTHPSICQRTSLGLKPAIWVSTTAPKRSGPWNVKHSSGAARPTWFFVAMYTRPAILAPCLTAITNRQHQYRMRILASVLTERGELMTRAHSRKVLPLHNICCHMC
jgi:hypothetical protein